MELPTTSVKRTGRTAIGNWQFQRRLDPEAIRDLVARRGGGVTIDQLAAEFGIHRTTVMAHMERHQAGSRLFRKHLKAIE